VNGGHNSKAMTRAYSRKTPVEMPAFSEYKKQVKGIMPTSSLEPMAQAITAQEAI
jgi:hypothetical protein